jgi:hypothetical protein
VEQEPKWNRPGLAGPPRSITGKGKVEQEEREKAVLVPGVVPPKMSAKVLKNPYFIIIHT